MSMTKELADFAARASFTDLPERVVHQTKRVILDTITCALAGYGTIIGKHSAEFVKELEGKRESTVVGSGERVSCANAAFANAKMANALDFDGTLGDSHPGPMALFSGLAVGERTKATGKDLITSVAVGIDISSRIGSSWIAPNPVYERARTSGMGFPIFAAVSSAGRILSLDATKMLQAFGIAGAYAPISSRRKWPVMPPGPLIKYLDAGWVTLGGVYAALLAHEGHTGYTTILDGDTGFWRMIDPEGVNMCDAMTKNLGDRWFIMDYIFKYFPCCHWQHGPLHLLVRILKEQNLKPEEIERIIVRLNANIVYISSNINTDPCRPGNLVGAQFSVPYNIAMAALGITPGPLWNDPARMKDPRVLDIAKKVTVEVEPTIYWPHNKSSLAGSIEVIAGGKTFSAYSDTIKGDSSIPEMLMTDEELKAKCRDSLANILRAKQVEKLIEAAYSLEKIDDLATLTRLLSIQLTNI
jgi:2-methylcitrate dehydratase PrpD